MIYPAPHVSGNPFQIHIGDYGHRLVSDDEADQISNAVDLDAVIRHIHANQRRSEKGYFIGDIWAAIYTYLKLHHIDQLRCNRVGRELDYNNTGEYLYSLIVVRLVEEGYLYRIAVDKFGLNRWYEIAKERLA
jgi:hypothetical protein